MAEMQEKRKFLSFAPPCLAGESLVGITFEEHTRLVQQHNQKIALYISVLGGGVLVSLTFDNVTKT